MKTDHDICIDPTKPVTYGLSGVYMEPGEGCPLPRVVEYEPDGTAKESLPFKTVHSITYDGRRYDFLEQTGRGNVYDAIDLQTGEIVKIKIPV